MTPDERKRRNAECQQRRRQHYGYHAIGPTRDHHSDPLPRDLVVWIDARIEQELAMLRGER